MDRLFISVIMFTVVRMVLPPSWLQHHSAWSYALSVCVALLGGVLYKFHVVSENVRGLRARWAWYTKEQDLGFMIVFSWGVVPVILMNARIDTLRKIEYILLAEVLLFGASLLFFLCLLFFAEDKEKIRERHVNLWQKESVTDKEFFFFRYFFFPFAICHLFILLLKGMRAVLEWALQTLHAFSSARGLPEDATAWRRATWWTAYIARQTIIALWSLGGALARFLKSCLIAMRDAAVRLLFFVLTPTQDRAFLALVEMMCVIGYAKVFDHEGNPIIYLVGGVLLGTLHATAGPRLAEQLRKRLSP